MFIFLLFEPYLQMQSLFFELSSSPLTQPTVAAVVRENNLAPGTPSSMLLPQPFYCLFCLGTTRTNVLVTFLALSLGITPSST